jgi:hypothetical protein
MMTAHAQLPPFVTVAKLLNLSAAARKLGITQTGATQRIKPLEQSLGEVIPKVVRGRESTQRCFHSIGSKTRLAAPIDRRSCGTITAIRR